MAGYGHVTREARYKMFWLNSEFFQAYRSNEPGDTSETLGFMKFHEEIMSELQADFVILQVIGADGHNSFVRGLVVEGDLQATHTVAGIPQYEPRANISISTKDMKENPDLKSLCHPNELTIWMGNGSSVVGTVDSTGETLNLSICFPTYQETAEGDCLQKLFQLGYAYCSTVQQMFEQDDIIGLDGTAVLVGDAAHSALIYGSHNSSMATWAEYLVLFSHDANEEVDNWWTTWGSVVHWLMGSTERISSTCSVAVQRVRARKYPSQKPQFQSWENDLGPTTLFNHHDGDEVHVSSVADSHDIPMHDEIECRGSGALVLRLRRGLLDKPTQNVNDGWTDCGDAHRQRTTYVRGLHSATRGWVSFVGVERDLAQWPWTRGRRMTGVSERQNQVPGFEVESVGKDSRVPFGKPATGMSEGGETFAPYVWDLHPSFI
ncbi:hypothetical protein B0H11DRAFT_1935666 [Mycena galericulata]|nr:hypothetical protein B0H11DRAFT_1935666 [Mycena galericulata]